MPPAQPVVDAAGRFRIVDYVKSTGSTNDDLVALCGATDLAARVLVAGEQTAGKGRRGRSWQQPAGSGLSMSLWIPWRNQESAFALPVCLGLAALDAAGTAGARHLVGLKWPNDVVSLTDGKKVGGLLAEAVASGTQFRGVVCGIGCNVSWPKQQDTEYPDATCLGELGDRTPSIGEFASAVISSFDQLLLRLERDGLDSIMGSYRARCVTIGQVVRVERSEEVLVGKVLDISDDGQLALATDSGMRLVATGDVVRVRPDARP